MFVCTYCMLCCKSVAAHILCIPVSCINFKNDSESLTEQQWNHTWLMPTKCQGEEKDCCWDCRWKSCRNTLPMHCYFAHIRPTILMLYIHLIGASLSEPHTSMTSLHLWLLACLNRPLTINHFRFLFCVVYVIHYIQRPIEKLKTWTMNSLAPQWWWHTAIKCLLF